MMRKTFTLLLASLGFGFAAQAKVFNVQATVSNQFVPASMKQSTGYVIHPGDTIRWAKVGSGADHTTTSLPGQPGGLTWDSPLSTAQPTFEIKVLATGDYSYKCTPHAQAGMLGYFTVYPTSAVYNVELSELTVVAPNPAVNQIRVTTSLKDAGISLFDMTGKRVMETKGNYDGSGYTVDVSNIPSGNYTMHMWGGDDVVIKQIVVAH